MYPSSVLSFVKPVFVLLLLSVLSVCVAFQARLPVKIIVGDNTEKYISGFYEIGHGEGRTYRWAGRNATVTFPDIGRAVPIDVSVVTFAWRDPTQIYTATVTVNGYDIGSVSRAGWRSWRFPVSDPAILRTDELVVGFHSTGFIHSELWPGSGDDREYGIAIEAVEIQPRWKFPTSLEGCISLVTIPSAPQLIFVPMFATAAYLLSRFLGLRERKAFCLGVAASVCFAIGIAFFRIAASERVLILTVTVGVVAAAASLRNRNQTGIAKEGTSLSRQRQLGVAMFVVPACIVIVGVLLRLHALNVLPVEGDDRIYMDVAAYYAQAIAAGDWMQVITYDGATGHPAFNELAFAVSVVFRDSVGIPFSHVQTMRLLAVVFGVLQVGLLALLNPLAGWFLAIQTTEVKFTSMAYLEALPALTATISVLAFERFRHTLKYPWMYVSAIALGATGASKFTYLAVGFAVLPFLLWEQRRRPQAIILYGLLAGLAFFAFDPYLWLDPINRLRGMFSFHITFSQRDYVKELARPWWYNLAVLAESAKVYAPSYKYPPAFLLVWDGLIFGLGVLGILALWRHSRLYVAWLVMGAVFISIWEAKWEQYAMLIATPLCLSAGYGVTDVLAWFRDGWQLRFRRKRLE